METNILQGVEIWKPIESYAEGKYEVSSWGRVRNIRLKKILKQATKPGGYKSINASSYSCASVHKLVALAFIPNPNNYNEIDHIDNNPSNNRVENLRWVTRRENCQHAQNHGRMKGFQGDAYNIVISKEGVTKTFVSALQCARFLCSPINSILQCARHEPGRASVKGWTIEFTGETTSMSDIERKQYKVLASKDGIEVVFKNSDEASRFLNVCKSSISQVATGQQKQCFGYTFKYIDKE